MFLASFLNRVSFFFVCTSALFSSQAFAQGAGVRGGGEILICREGTENETREVWDGYEARTRLQKNERRPSDLSREGFLKWVGQRLSANPDLSNAVVETLNRIGPIDSWGANDAEAEFTKFKINHLDSILQVLSFMKFESGALDRWIGIKARSTTRTFDSFSNMPIPSGCQIKQLATNDRNVAVISNPQVIPQDDWNRRLIELHEALYILGARDYGHPHPMMVRSLVESMLDGRLDDEALISMEDRFVNFEKNKEQFLRKHVGVLPGVGVFSGLSQAQLNPRSIQFKEMVCPATLAVEYDGFNGILIRSYYLAKDAESVRVSHRLSFDDPSAKAWPGLGGIHRSKGERISLFSDEHYLVYVETTIPDRYQGRVREQLQDVKAWKKWSALPYHCRYDRYQAFQQLTAKDWIWLLEDLLN